MIFLLIVFILSLILWLCRGWIARKTQESMAKKMMSMMGVPPEVFEEAKREQKKARRNTSRNRRQTSSSHNRKIPPEYAEDVAFVEIHTEETITVKTESQEWHVESQVSDAEWEEIK